MTAKKGTDADVFQILKKDHETVTKLMNQLKKSDASKREELFLQVRSELETHMNLEEQYFYPRLEDIEEISDLIQDCLADHDDLRKILSQMENEEPDSEEWETACQALEDTKEDHVDLEEHEVFPQAIEMIAADELEQMAEQLVSAKSRSTKEAGEKAKRPAKGRPEARM